MQNISIAYGGMSPGCDAPGDRRRFSGFAARQNLIFESLTRETKKTDVAILTLGGDLSIWKSLRKRHGKLVLDIVDSYFDESKMSIQRQLRGPYKSLNRELHIPHLRYTELLKRVCEHVDAVICASWEQKKTLENMNGNVHVIVDCFDELIGGEFYQRKVCSPKKILWEGMTDNLKHLQLLNLKEGDPELVLLTSPVMRQRLSLVQAKSTNDYINRLNILGSLKPWNLKNLKQIGDECTVGVIPIQVSNPMAWKKSENKLLGLWALGMPVLVSPTPSYSRVLVEAQLPECLVSDTGWRQKILELSNDLPTLNRIAQTGYEYASDRVRGIVLDPLWKQSLNSVGLSL